ncbi:MAG: hypothetical protein IJB59_09860 [Oscillospiraceae bacterium]|nr:hypothetical protein [Oscillospiraceae bacterium]
MAIVPFLAVTEAEIRKNSSYPQKTAWMGCTFSSWNPGLSNLPFSLPPESALILTDQTPFSGHDPDMILRQLEGCIQRLSCCALVLDLQRSGVPEVAELTRLLSESLPCPVIVSACYGQDISCPVFLPPVPPSVPAEEYLKAWKGREIWLELALDGEIITLTSKGAQTTPLPCGCEEDGFSDKPLHCHYHTETDADSARFTLWRTREDLDDLISEAAQLGVAEMIGLYQELAM